MPYHDFMGTSYPSGVTDVKKFWENFQHVVRDPHSRYSLRQDSDGFYWADDSDEDENCKIKVEEGHTLEDYKHVIYKKDGSITVNLKPQGNRRVYYNDYMMRNLMHVLPESIHIFQSTGNNKKFYVIWEPGKDVRAPVNQYSGNGHSPDKMWELTEAVVHFMPDKSVKGAKLRKRGPKIVLEKAKPLTEFLERKHIKEMTKARLEGDLEVSLETKYATFRTAQTGLYHVVIEMSKPSCYGEEGPNHGLIRRLSVGRFVDKKDIERCNQIAWDICKDIPDSMKRGLLVGDRPSA